MTTLDIAQVDHLLSTTRAVRKRLDLSRSVPRDVVVDCIRVATQAPTGGNVQRWRWLVVDDADKRAALADMYQRSYAPYIAERQRAMEGAGGVDDATRKIVDSSTYLAEHLHEVPVHVIPCALDRLPAGMPQGQVAGFYGSILPAVWSLQLALRARGLGSAWTTLHLAYEDEACELLGIPTTVTQVALIPVAYYTGTDFKPAPRRPVEEVTYFNAWRQRA